MSIHELFPYLRTQDAAQAIAFYEKAFGAKEKFRLVEPGTGRVGHAELGVLVREHQRGSSEVELGFRGPRAVGATTVSIHLHVDDADAAIQRAVEAGAVVVRPATDAFYGERSGTVRDPFGHEWMIGHSIEEVTPEEMQRRYDALMKG